MRENCEKIGIAEEIPNCIAKYVLERLMYSDSGRILRFLYSLTPWGRKEIRESGDVVIIGSDSVAIEKPFSNEYSSRKNEMLQKIFSDTSFFRNQSHDLQEAFAAYEGNLVDATNSRKIVGHEGKVDDSITEELYVPVDDLHVSFINKTPDAAGEEEDSIDNSESDRSSSDEEEVDSGLDEEEEVDEHTNGVIEDNTSTLKEIARLQGHDEQQISEFVTQYGSWLLGDTAQTLIHEEYLTFGHECWMMYTSFTKIGSFAKFCYPLMGIVASEATCERAFWHHRRIVGDQGMKMGVALEKAKMFYFPKCEDFIPVLPG